MFGFIELIKKALLEKGNSKNYLPRFIQKRFSRAKRQRLAKESLGYRKSLEKAHFGTFSPIRKFNVGR